MEGNENELSGFEGANLSKSCVFVIHFCILTKRVKFVILFSIYPF